MRYTRKFIQARFAMAMEALGVPHGPAYSPKPDGGYTANVGTYFVDHNSVYGGYQICRMANEAGGESLPFGMGRHSASEFVALLDGVINAASIMKEGR